MKDYLKKLPLEIILTALIAIGVGLGLLYLAHTLSVPPTELTVHNQKILITNPDSFWKFFSKELGFALIISGFLALTIDYLTKRKHDEAADRLVERLNTRLFHTVLGRDLPANLYSFVKEQILETCFYRKDFKVTFELGTNTRDNFNPDVSKYIKLTEHTHYKLINISTSPKEHIISLHVDPVIFPVSENIPVSRFLFLKINGKIVETTKSENAFSSDEINLQHKITLDPNQEVDIDSSSFTYMRLIDEQVFVVTQPTDELRIIAVSHHPSLACDAFALHPKKLELVHESTSFKEWSLNSFLIGGQGFLIKWSDTRSDNLVA